MENNTGRGSPPKRGRPFKKTQEQVLNELANEDNAQPMPKPTLDVDAQDGKIALSIDDNPVTYENQSYEQQARRILPESDLELNYAFTNPQWGDDTVNPNLQELFKKRKMITVPRGQIFYGENQEELVSDGTVKLPEDKNYWANLAWLTRDLRLANYDKTTYAYCSYYYELAGALLNEGYYQAAALAMQIGAIHGEMSQGRGGFLRQMQNTLIKKEEHQIMEVKKNNILSSRPKDNYGGQY